MRKMKKWILLLLVLLIVMVLIFWYRDNQDINQERKSELVKTATVTKGAVERQLSYTGSLEPLDYSVVTSIVEGRVKKLFFSYGGLVKTGDLLFTLDSPALVSSFNSNLVDYLKQKRDYEKAKQDEAASVTMFNSKVISAEERQTERNAFIGSAVSYYQTTATLEKILLQVGITFSQIGSLSLLDKDVTQQFSHYFDNIRVYSNSDGVALFPSSGSGSGTSSDKLSIGSEVKHGAGMLSIGKLTGFTVEFKIGENDVTEVREGMPVVVSGVAFPDKQMKGHVSAVSSQADSSGGSSGGQFSAAVVIPSVPVDLKSIAKVGMTAQISIPMKSEKELQVPINAIQFDPKTSKAYVVRVDKDNATSQVSVTTGVTSPSGNIVVKGALKEGDKVVIHDSF